MAIAVPTTETTTGHGLASRSAADLGLAPPPGRTSANGQSAKLTDLAYSYSPRGEVTNVYESTPNSGGYYHSTVSYWPNGLPDQLTGPGFPTIDYEPDGQGRVSTAGGTGNPVAATSHNVFGEPTSVTFGSGGSDVFAYDGSTGRMTKYTYNVGSKTVVGSLTWNTNGTPGTLAITDGLNASNTQTCNYTYDDLARINSVGCDNWSQTFTAGAFGDLSYTGSNGGTSFQPTFQTNPSITDRISQVGTEICTYDADGNLLSRAPGPGARPRPGTRRAIW